MILKFNVTGMTCAACSARVEKVSRAVPGVQKADVNLLAGTMVVSSDTDVSALVIQAVQKAGYNAVLQGTAAKKETASPMDTGLKEMKRRLIGSSISWWFSCILPWGTWLGSRCPAGITGRKMLWLPRCFSCA